MHDNEGGEGREERGGVLRPVGLPEWVKFAASIIGTLVVTLTWVEARFVSRVEWTNHQAQQVLDMAQIKATQAEYAIAERGTSANLGDISERLASIESDVSWLRAYLDVSKPPPRVKNGNGKVKP